MLFPLRICVFKCFSIVLSFLSQSFTAHTFYDVVYPVLVIQSLLFCFANEAQCPAAARPHILDRNRSECCSMLFTWWFFLHRSTSCSSAYNYSNYISSIGFSFPRRKSWYHVDLFPLSTDVAIQVLGRRDKNNRFVFFLCVPLHGPHFLQIVSLLAILIVLAI